MTSDAFEERYQQIVDDGDGMEEIEIHIQWIISFVLTSKS